MTSYVRYSDDVEQVQDGEEEAIERTIEAMRHTMVQTFEQHRHATSGTHAKSHAVATGSVTVAGGLPTELAQGLFAIPGTYEVVVRIASEPGQIDPDTAKRARGLALKVLDVPGEKLEDAWPSHDMLFNTWPIIPEGDVHAYLAAIEQRDRHAGHHLRASATSLLRNKDPKGLLFDSTPNIHPLAHTYYSQAAFRHGDHVAKYRMAPGTDAQRALSEVKVGSSDPPFALRDLARDWALERETVWDLGVQLCTDLDAMPVEDASVPWDEEASPYRTVATVTLPAQETFSPARRTFAEDRMGWRPWYGLAAHRPLGSINRVRRRAYEELGRWRAEQNAVELHEPRSANEVPA